MKKLFLLLLGGVLLNSCVSFKLENSIWCNLTPTELGNQKADVITSLCFYENDHIGVNTCVKKDSTIIIPSTQTAMGEYTCVKGKNNSLIIHLNLTDTYGLQETKTGIITKEGLFLCETDSIARVYFKSNLTPKNK